MHLYVDMRIGNEVLADEIGADFASIEDATKLAQASIRELVADDLRFAKPDVRRGFLIRDEAGSILVRQTYRVAVSVEPVSFS